MRTAGNSESIKTRVTAAKKVIVWASMEADILLSEPMEDVMAVLLTKQAKFQYVTWTLFQYVSKMLLHFKTSKEITHSVVLVKEKGEWTLFDDRVKTVIPKLKGSNLVSKVTEILQKKWKRADNMEIKAIKFEP